VETPASTRRIRISKALFRRKEEYETGATPSAQRLPACCCAALSFTIREVKLGNATETPSDVASIGRSLAKMRIDNCATAMFRT